MILRAPSFNRRQFARVTTLLGFAAASRFALAQDSATADPWPSAALLQPADLAERMKSTETKLRIVCVAFPVLYRQRHIAGSVFAGPGGKPDGIRTLRSALSKFDKSSNVVLYCGCCPMIRCPNIRPAYKAARQTGFEHVYVLELAENFHADWVVKGYPVST